MYASRWKASDSLRPGVRVSVIMPFLNAECFLEEAIQSVLAQSYTAWELLLVDDGSTDGSTAIARRYAEQHPEKIRYFEHEGHQNRGASASRNLAITHARGEYLAPLDADDVSEPGRLAKQVAFLDAHPEVALVGSGYVEIDGTGRRLRRSRKPCTYTEIRWVLLFYCPFLHSSVMMRKAPVAEKVGWYDEALVTSEDYELWRRIARILPVANLPEPLVRYRVHEKSLTATVGRRSEVGARMRLAPATRLLGWNDGTFEANKRRLNAMTALLLGWGNSLEPDDLDRAVTEIFHLHSAFCREEGIEADEAAGHLADLQRVISKNLIFLTKSWRDLGTIRRLLTLAYRVHWPTFLNPRIQLAAGKMLTTAFLIRMLSHHSSRPAL